MFWTSSVGMGVFVRDPELAKKTMTQAEEGEDHLAITDELVRVFLDGYSQGSPR